MPAHVCIDVDLSEFDTEELIHELQLRRKEEAEGLCWWGAITLNDIKEALQREDTEAALEMMRTYLQDTTGCVIPLLNRLSKKGA